MTKRFLTILSLLLILVLTLSFISCGKDDDKEAPKDEGPHETGNYVSVTKDEWIKAFKFEGVNSFTVNASSNYDDGSSSNEVVKYCNNEFYSVYTSIDTDEEDRETMYGKHEGIADIFCFEDFVYDEACEEVLYTIYDFLDYGYNKATYNENAKCYTISVTNEYGTDTLKIYFGENKLLSKFLLTQKDNDGETESYSIEFSNYNSTEEIQRPNSGITEVIDLYRNLTPSQIYRCDGTFSIGDSYETVEITNLDEIISIVNSALANLDINNVYEFDQEENGANTTYYHIESTATGTISISGVEFDYSKITLSTHDGSLYFTVGNDFGDYDYILIEFTVY